MANTFYTQYVQHCMRFYARHPRPIFHSEADKKNWNACESALEDFTDKEKELLIALYTENDTIPDNVYKVSTENKINQDTLWSLLNKLEQKVAKRRNLI